MPKRPRPYFLTSKLFPFAKAEEQVLLPDSQVYKLGLLYSSYRFLISVFLFVSSYAAMFKNDVTRSVLPSLLQQSILLFYCLFSLLLLGFFFIAREKYNRELLIGLIIDIVFIGVLLFINGAADIQLVILYIVVVFVSFMLLLSYQAIIITMLAIISVIYHQSYQALTNNLNLASFGEALLLSMSFICVGYLSWYISQRLAIVEQMAADNANKNAQLNAINQEIIHKMEQGVVVLDEKRRIILSNSAAHTLLSIELDAIEVNNDVLVGKREKLKKAFNSKKISSKKNSYNQLERTIHSKHHRLIEWVNHIPIGIKSELLYHYKHNQLTEKVRLTTLPMQDGIVLIMMEDLNREQTNAQQLKLASLGQLTASIAHEIRNPLAAISQASQLLIEDVNALDDNALDNQGSIITQRKSQNDMLLEANKELYSMIFNQTKRVNRIIEDVLKLSRQAKPEQLRLPIQDWTIDFIANHYANQPVSFVNCCAKSCSSADVYVFFDPSQLEQVLTNLINNGLRFSQKVSADGYVEVMISCKNNYVYIDILDSGAGVDSNKFEHLFMPFFTTDNDGTGLGLYLSQAFAEANFARLIYNDKHDKTCFRLILPNAK